MKFLALCATIVAHAEEVENKLIKTYFFTKNGTFFSENQIQSRGYDLIEATSDLDSFAVLF